MKNQLYCSILAASFFLGLFMVQSSAVAQEKERSTRFYILEYEGEQYLYGELDPIDVTAKYPNRLQRRRGKRKLQKYTRLRWNIHKVYPYALKVSQVLEELDAELAEMQTEAEKEAYIKTRESALFGEYESAIRKMSRSQGKVLVKLIHRQTGASAYDLIRSTKSGAAALFWQSIGRIFGINLKIDYDPEEDEMIEDIVKELEKGGYNIYYRKYNYSLS